MKKKITFSILVGAIVLTLVGCGNESSAEVPASEEVSIEVSEEVSEEVSASEELSEEVSGKKLVREVKYSDNNSFHTYMSETNFGENVFCEVSRQEGKPQMLIYDGAKYTMQYGDILKLYPYKEVSAVESDSEKFLINPRLLAYQGTVSIHFSTVVEGLEVPLTIKYTDGTEEEMLIYVTVPEEVFEETVVEETVVEEIDLTEFTEDNGKWFDDLIYSLNCDELKIVVWRFLDGAQAILSNGDSYVDEGDDVYILVYHKPVKEVKITNGEILIDTEDYCQIAADRTTAGFVEVICEVTAVDGTTEIITVNIDPVP